MANPTALEPAFPGSIKDWEQGKFRPAATPRETLVAVSDDLGRSVEYSTVELLGEILHQLQINNAHLALITCEEEPHGSSD